MKTVKVKYQIASYSGVEEITYDPYKKCTADVYRMCEAQLVQKSGGVPFPFGARHFEIVE